MRIERASALTDSGPRRENNEDDVLVLEDAKLVAVADGMGGQDAGLLAAKLALSAVEEFAPQLVTAGAKVAKGRTTKDRLALTRLLDDLFNHASKSIQAAKNELSVPGMGSTLVLVMLVRNFAYVAHVGDSRAYLVRSGRLVRLTEDHSLAEYRFRRGRITREEYEASDERRLLYQALGAGVEVEADVAEVRLMEGDSLLLCSDGLTRALTPEQIESHLRGRADRDGRALIVAAANAKAEDNVSVVTVDLAPEPDDEPIGAITEVLESVFLFKDLTPTELLVIAPYLEEEVHAKGQTVVTQGEPGDTFYCVVSGRVRITRGPTHLVDVKEGGHFGELALARPVSRSATVRTLQRTRLLALNRDRFHDLLRQKPGLGAKLSLALLDTVGDRLRDLSDRISAVERAVRGERGQG